MLMGYVEANMQSLADHKIWKTYSAAISSTSKTRME